MDKDYSVEFNLTEGDLIASIKIVPTGTEVSGLTVDDLVAAINNEGITFGLIPEAIDQIVKDKTIDQWVIIARGRNLNREKTVLSNFTSTRTAQRLSSKRTPPAR